MKHNVKLEEPIVLFLVAAVPSQPTDFRGEAKSETSILLSWVAPAQTGQENQITGYELMYRKRDDKEEVMMSWHVKRANSDNIFACLQDLDCMHSCELRIYFFAPTETHQLWADNNIPSERPEALHHLYLSPGSAQQTRRRRIHQWDLSRNSADT